MLLRTQFFVYYLCLNWIRGVVSLKIKNLLLFFLGTILWWSLLSYSSQRIIVIFTHIILITIDVDVDKQFFPSFLTLAEPLQLAGLPSVLQSWAILFFIHFLCNLVLAGQSCSSYTFCAILLSLGNLVLAGQSCRHPYKAFSNTKLRRLQSFNDNAYANIHLFL